MIILQIMKLFRKKTNKCTMEVKRLRLLAVEIFKAFNENCPAFIKDYFEKKRIFSFKEVRFKNTNTK